MTVKRTMLRFGAPVVFEHPSIQEAAGCAYADVEWNEAMPQKIEQDGVVVWENAGPFSDSYDRLRQMAGYAIE